MRGFAAKSEHWFAPKINCYESEEPEQKQEQLLSCLPSVFPELMEVKHDDSNEDCVETDSHG
ncbi:hypothetical protein A2U01_0028851, partial [Trifolium medium]|nr:hypothetical protein [Trifolium medium]